MEHTWASGAIELLRHADSHIHLETAFDRRIAFISIDNSVETSIRTFLSLPAAKSGIKVPRKDIEAVENSFPGLLEVLWAWAGDRLTGIDEADIEHYHRIRNKLYHDGTGLSVDEQYLLAYRQIAVLLLNNLFSVSLEQPNQRTQTTLQDLIVLWNQVEVILREKLMKQGINMERVTLYKAVVQGQILSSADLNKLRELNSIRNSQVHSQKIDPQAIAHGVALAEELIAQLN